MWLLWKLMQLTLYFICDITAMCFGWILCSGLKWSRCFIQVKLIFTPMVTWPLFLGEIHQYSKSSSIEHEGINRKDKWQCLILAVGEWMFCYAVLRPDQLMTYLPDSDSKAGFHLKWQKVLTKLIFFFLYMLKEPQARETQRHRWQEVAGNSHP